MKELKITKQTLPQQELYNKAEELHKILRHGPVIDGWNDQTQHPHWMFETTDPNGWDGVMITAHHLEIERYNSIQFEFEKKGHETLIIEFLPEVPEIKQLEITKISGKDEALYIKAKKLLKKIKPGLIIDGEMDQTKDRNWVFKTTEPEGWVGVKIKVALDVIAKDVIVYTFEKEGYEQLDIKFLPVEVPVLKKLKITKQTGNPKDLYMKADGLFKTIKPGLIIDGDMDQTKDVNWMFDTKEVNGWIGVKIKAVLIPDGPNFNIIKFEFTKEGYEKLFIRFIPDTIPVLQQLQINAKNLGNFELFLRATLLYNIIEPGLVIDRDKDLTTMNNWIFETTEPEGWVGITVKMTPIKDETFLGGIKYTFKKEGYDPLNILFWPDEHIIE